MITVKQKKIDSPALETLPLVLNIVCVVHVDNV